MKASELRVNNNVMQGVVHAVASRLVEVNDGGGHCIYEAGAIKPIPLTEEWLLKFGFEKIKNDRKFFNSYIFKREINAYNTWFCVYYFIYNATGENTEYYKSYFEKNHHNHIDYQDNYGNFDYVHQLQNLYFALTGEELTLNI